MIASRRWSLIAAAALAACGGSSIDTSTTDGGGDDASTADAGGDDAATIGDSGDMGYLACMSASGQLDESLKTCQSDGECVIEQEQTDCCGTILYAGVNAASVTKFDACEASWVAHFPRVWMRVGADEDGRRHSDAPRGGRGRAAGSLRRLHVERRDLPHVHGPVRRRATAFGRERVCQSRSGTRAVSYPSRRFVPFSSANRLRHEGC